MIVRESYDLVHIGANGSFTIEGPRIAGFLAKTTGTITVTRADASVPVSAIPVTAGIYTPIPGNTGPLTVVTLASGASGTLFF